MAVGEQGGEGDAGVDSRFSYGRRGQAGAIGFDGRTTISDHLSIDGMMSWTRPDKHGESTEIAARRSKSFVHRVVTGDSLHWRVSIAALDIGVRASFAASTEQKTREDQELLADTRVRSASPDKGKVLEGAFEAQTDGLFTLTLDNSFSRLRSKRVTWSITELRYVVLDRRSVLTIYSSQGGRLIEQLPLIEANAAPLQSVEYPPGTFELMLGDERHLFHASSKARRGDWLSSLSIASQLNTMQRHAAATLIQRVVRRMIAVNRFMRLRRHAVDRAALQKSIQEQLVPSAPSSAEHRQSGAADGVHAIANGTDTNTVTDVLMQHEHWGLRGFRAAFLSRVPSAIRVPAWCDADGVEVAPLTASQAEAQSAADDRLPSGWRWADAAWKLDRTGSKDPDGWQYAQGLPVLLGWHSQSFVGNLVRRRKWIRVRNKIQVKSGASSNSPALNSIFVTSRKCSFIGRFSTASGVVMNIWRPTVPPSHRILGDSISAGEDPPSSFVSVDMEKVANSRPMFMRHWVHDVTQFTMVWSNGRVWAWRPIPPSVPPQLLRKKRLQPLGWVFTTTAAPPDVENVAVVSEAFLDPISAKVLGEPEEIRTPSGTARDGPTLPLSELSDQVGSDSEFIQASVTASTEYNVSAANTERSRAQLYAVSRCKFVVDTTTKFLFLSSAESTEADTVQQFYQDHDGLSSLFRLKKQVAPAEQMDSIARSSRYAPHLHALMQAEPPQAYSDPIVCSTLLSSRYYAGSRIEMVTASGNILRVWDLSKGECTRELKFHLDAVTCIAAAGQLVFSGAGKVLIGSDMVAGCQIPGAQFRHASFVTCVDAQRVLLSDRSTVIAVASGTDMIGKRVRLWVSSEVRGLSSELSFFRVGMPSIGVHPGAVTSCKIWHHVTESCADAEVASPSAFHFVRIAVSRSTNAQAVTLSKLCLMDSRGVAIPPSRALDLTSGRPVEVDISEGDDAGRMEWSIRPAAGIARQSSACSFGRCLLAVLELQFERGVVLESIAWEMSQNEPPLHWSSFGSANWQEWYQLTEPTQPLPTQPKRNEGTNRKVRSNGTEANDEKNPSTSPDKSSQKRNGKTPGKKEAALVAFCSPVLPWVDCLPVAAPHAAEDFYHIPLLLSTCASTIRVWSVCKDMQSSVHKGVCVAEIKAGNAPADLSTRLAESWHREAHEGEITCCTVMHGSRVVTGSRDGTLKVWHPALNQCEATLHAESRVVSCKGVTLRTSAHLGAERVALRSDQPHWHNQTFTIRHLTQLNQSPGGEQFISGSGDSPTLIEPGETLFETLSWWLVPGSNGRVTMHCRRNGKICSLGIVAGKIAMLEGVSYDWVLKFDASAVVRTHRRQQFGGGRGGGGGGGGGNNGGSNVEAWPLYSVAQPMNVYRSANTEQPPLELAVGDLLQLIGTHVLFQQSVWQQVCVVKTEENRNVNGWMVLDDVELNGCLVPLKQTTTAVQLCTPDGKKALAAAESGGKLYLEHCAEVRDSGWWRFEEATPVQMVAAGCEDGSTKFWTQDSKDGPWVPNAAASKLIRHSCPSTSVSIIASDTVEGVPASLLAITCNRDTNEDARSIEQPVAVWRLDESQELNQQFDRALRIRSWIPFAAHNICRLHPLVVEDYVAGMVKYVDKGSGDGFEMTFAEPSTTSLTTTDLLRTKVQFEGLFFQLISHMRLKPAVSSVSRRSTNRVLDPANAFVRNASKANSTGYLYWITHASTDTGYPLTFIQDERLALEDCAVGSIIRDASMAADHPGGIYMVEKAIPPRISSYVHLDDGTIEVRKVNPDNSFSNEVETGRVPAEFIAPGFWEGYLPRQDFPMLIFMLLPCVPYNLAPAASKLLKQLSRRVGSLVYKLIGKGTPDPSDNSQTLKKTVTMRTVGPSLDQQRELEWQELLGSARLGSPVQACFVPLPDAAGPYSGSHMNYSRLLPCGPANADSDNDDPLELSLLHACVEYSSTHPEDQHELFSLEVPEVIVQYKWMTYGCKYVYSSLRAYLWLVFSFSTFAVRTVQGGPFGEVGTAVLDHFIVVVALCLTLWFITTEVWSLAAQGWMQYLRDGWNWMDWVCYILVLYCLLAGYTFSLSSSWTSPWSPSLAVVELILWGKVLYFLRAFEATGVYILTMVHIIRDIREFILIMALILLGFGFAFFVLFNDSDAFNGEDVKYAYQSLSYALLSTFNMGVMGDFSMDMFHNQEHEVLLLGLFVTSAAIITVIMLNMLIALMSSTYERATQHSAAASKYQRAEILLDIEATMTMKERCDPTYFPRYLHVLKQKQVTTRGNSETHSTHDATTVARRTNTAESMLAENSSSLRGTPDSTSVGELLAKVCERQEEQAVEMKRISEMLEKLCSSQGNTATSGN